MKFSFGLKPLRALALGATWITLVGWAQVAQAIEFTTVQLPQSKIGFAYKQMGVSIDGSFKKFSAQLSFDPAKLATAKGSIEVDIASIDTGSAEANDEVLGKAWFNSKSFPSAKFVATSFKSVGANRYEVAGVLTMKGRSQNLIAPTTVNVVGNTATFDGVLPIKRGDFAIGEGEWADFGIVANEIQIKFHLQASAAK